MSALFRDRVVQRLKQDLVGPLSEKETLTDRPTQRYSTGILYPRDSQIEPEEDQDGGLAVNEDEDSASGPDTSGVSLQSTMKPSAAGLSFAVKPMGVSDHPVVTMEVRCARYRRFGVDEAGEEVDGEPTSRPLERWRRLPYLASAPITLALGETRLDLALTGSGGVGAVRSDYSAWWSSYGDGGSF